MLFRSGGKGTVCTDDCLYIQQGDTGLHLRACRWRGTPRTGTSRTLCGRQPTEPHASQGRASQRPHSLEDGGPLQTEGRAGTKARSWGEAAGGVRRQAAQHGGTGRWRQGCGAEKGPRGFQASGRREARSDELWKLSPSWPSDRWLECSENGAGSPERGWEDEPAPAEGGRWGSGTCRGSLARVWTWG